MGKTDGGRDITGGWAREVVWREILGEGGLGLRDTRTLAYFVAMPEQRASVFKATLSPRRIFLTGPLTVAQCLIGSNGSPSLMCHSTL